jgi:amino acid adenylation domain-containing protein
MLDAGCGVSIKLDRRPEDNDRAMIARRFVESALRHGRRPALILGQTVVTYDELTNEVARIAALLVREAPAGICTILTSRSRHGFAAVAGALSAGFAYMPVRPDTPVERFRARMAIADPTAIVADASSLDLLREFVRVAPRSVTILLPDHSTVPDFDGIRRHRIFCANDINAVPPLTEPVGDDAEALAYLLFTSGSSGTAKGVPIRRRNLLAYLDGFASLYPLTPDDRCTQLFDLTFDLSVHDIFATWCAGAALVVAPELDRGLSASDIVRQHRVTQWFSVPSVVSLLQRYGKLRPGSMPSLRRALFCGERLTVATAKAMAVAAPTADIVNLYGPTEATIAITHHRWTGAASHGSGDVPIGHPLPGQRAVVLDGDGRRAEYGVVGELHLGGSQVGDGYWRNPNETAGRFYATDEAGAAPVRWYRSGDLVVEHPQHGLVFRGRSDEQIKLRGIRVELGEVEAAVQRAANGAPALALAWPLDDGGAPMGIVVYVERSSATAREIYAGCSQWLPPYMRPQQIIEIERLPTNANGKLDRQRLLALHCGERRAAAVPASGAEVAAP